MTTIPDTDRPDYPVETVSHYIVSTLATLGPAQGRTACGALIREGQASVIDPPRCPICAQYVLGEEILASMAEAEHTARLREGDRARDEAFRAALVARKATALHALRRRTW